MRKVNSLSAVLFFFFLAGGCGKNNSDVKVEQQTEATNKTSSTSRDNAPGEYVSLEKTEGEAIPNFHWKDTGGNAVDLSSYTDKVTLVNFWATWCGPCNLETPDLIETNGLFKDKGVRFLGISVDAGNSAKEEVQLFMDKFKVNYPMIIDRDDELQGAFGNVRGYPTTFLVNKERKVLSSWVGIRSKDFFIAEIQKYLN